MLPGMARRMPAPNDAEYVVRHSSPYGSPSLKALHSGKECRVVYRVARLLDSRAYVLVVACVLAGFVCIVASISGGAIAGKFENDASGYISMLEAVEHLVDRRERL